MRIAHIVAGAALLSAALLSYAQEYPNRTIRMVVPAAASEPAPMAPDAFSAVVRDEYAKRGKVIAHLDIKPQ